MQCQKWYFCDSFLINFIDSLYQSYETNKYNKQYVETQLNVTTDKRLFISDFEIYVGKMWQLIISK